MIMVAFILVWIVCGIASYGITFAYHQAEFSSIAEEHYREDVAHSALFALFGPIALLVALGTTGFAKHGWRWR